MIFAKDYHIEMLSVGAADAFILYVIDTQDNEHLILIDARFRMAHKTGYLCL